MFVTNLISAIAVITMSPNYSKCLAHKPVLQSFLMKPYQLVSNDINFDKILQELDIGWLWRKGIEMEKPLMELTWNPDTDIYTFTEKYSLKQFVAPFKIGKKSKLKTIDGCPVMALFTVKENVLTEIQEQNGKPTVVIQGTFNKERVVVKIQIKDIISYRVYEPL